MTLFYRKRPIEVYAVQWTGSNEDELEAFAGTFFDPLTDSQRDDSDDPEASAEVFDELHNTWVRVYDGDWIIQGIKGEFYPCRADVFETTYEEVPA
jgi:hypothetical protein